MFNISALCFAALGALTLIFIFILRSIFIYFLDPLDLRKYPAPSWLAAVSPLWLMRETWLQRRSRAIHEALEHSGEDIIRVGPDVLMFNNPQAVTDIYGHQAARKIIKDVFYDKMAGDFHDIVNSRDHADHARKRKYLSNSFALKTVVEMEPVIRSNFGSLINRIDTFCNSEEERASCPQECFNIRLW